MKKSHYIVKTVKNVRCLMLKIKGASYVIQNNPVLTIQLKKAIYCGSCKLENVVDIESEKCITCNKARPNFNYLIEKNIILWFM